MPKDAAETTSCQLEPLPTDTSETSTPSDPSDASGSSTTTTPTPTPPTPTITTSPPAASPTAGAPPGGEIDLLPNIIPFGSISLLSGAAGLGKTALLAGIAKAFRDSTLVFGHQPTLVAEIGIVNADRGWDRSGRVVHAGRVPGHPPVLDGRR